MNFRSKNHFLEFSRINRKLAPGMIDTRRTRRVPGRGSSGVVRGCREVRDSEHAAQPKASGDIHPALGSQRTRDSLRVSLGTRGGSEGSLGSLLFRHSGTDGNSGDIRGESSRCGVFGDISHFRKSLSAQPSGHVARSEGRTEGFGSKACRKGLSGNGFRADFRDRWHSPKGGPAGASAESSKGGLRQGFGKISKGSEGGSSKGFPRGASGLVFEGGFRRELRRVAFRAGYHR